jgi:hypothetical protein
MTNDKDEDRLSHALKWCKEREIKNRLDLFSKKHKKKLVKGNLSKKEFDGMCKKAGVKKESLCRTILTDSIVL